MGQIKLTKRPIRLSILVSILKKTSRSTKKIYLRSIVQVVGNYFDKLDFCVESKGFIYTAVWNSVINE